MGMFGCFVSHDPTSTRITVILGAAIVLYCVYMYDISLTIKGQYLIAMAFP